VAPFELLPTDPRLWANANFPGFDFPSSRIFLMGGTNPFLVAFDPDASLNFRGKLSANVLRPRLPEFQDQPSSVPPGDRR